jgi:hypothetical protein
VDEIGKTGGRDGVEPATSFVCYEPWETIQSPPYSRKLVREVECFDLTHSAVASQIQMSLFGFECIR